MPLLFSQSQDVVLHLSYFRCHRLMGKATLARQGSPKKALYGPGESPIPWPINLRKAS